MSSKGKYVSGTDGTDYTHRQRVVKNHAQSAESKRYLSMTFYLHFLIAILIVLKLAEDLLDRAGVFIDQIQELELPRPDIWEWFYGFSIFFTVLAGRAIRINSARLIKWYMVSLFVLAIGPLFVAEYKYLPEFVEFIEHHDVDRLAYTWRSLPLAVVFQGFAIVALQVHLIQLYYAYQLYKIWANYTVGRQQQNAVNKKKN